MMIIFCIVVGIIESYFTIKTGNCMYAAIIHGVINITELAKALPNGPLLGVHLSQLGYQTKSISLATKEGKNQFY